MLQCETNVFDLWPIVDQGGRVLLFWSEAMKQKKKTKSQMIREYMKTNPKASNSDCIKALKAKGVSVSSSAVHGAVGRTSHRGPRTVASKPTKRSRKKATRQPSSRRGAGSHRSNGVIRDRTPISIGQLQAAQHYAEECGSVQAAQQSLDVLEGLQLA